MLVALRAVAWLVARLPFAWLSVPGAALGLLVGSGLRVRRRAVEAAMRRAGVAPVARVARAMYRGLGQGVFELLWLFGRRGRAHARHVELSPGARAALEAALARGPVVIAASHTGNWELAAHAASRALRARGRGLAVVAKAQGVAAADVFARDLRQALGVRVIAPEGAVAACLDVLGRGDVVAMPIDQVPARETHGERVSFLGAPALADRAPASLACRAGATLLVVASRRVGTTHEVRVLASLRPGEGEGSLRACAARATREATRALDAFVRAYPETWLWLHRRWRAPAGAASAAGASGPRGVARRRRSRGGGALVPREHPG